MPQNRPSTPVRTDRGLVHPAVARTGSYAWKLIGIGIVGWALLQLLTVLWVLVLAGAIAVLLGRALDPIASRLRRTGMPRALVAADRPVGLVVGVQTFGLQHELVVLGMADALDDGDDDGLVHRVGHDDALVYLA